MIYEAIITTRARYERHPFTMADANVKEYIAECAYFSMITDEYDLFHNCDHDDLLQDCYLYTYEHWDTLSNFPLSTAISHTVHIFVAKATTKKAKTAKSAVYTGVTVNKICSFDSIESGAINSVLYDTLLDKMRTLTPREERVLTLRFGMDDGITMFLDEVGDIMGVTRERIRQVEAKALRKLRHPSRSRDLKDYLGGL